MLRLRTFLSVCIPFVMIVSLLNPLGAYAAVPEKSFEERVVRFESVLEIKKSAEIQVTETIVYNFSTAENAPERHGIIRKIPVIARNKDNVASQIDFTLISVTDMYDKAFPYKQSRVGENIEIKIGDPNRTIQGEYTFRITYNVKGPIQYYSDHDELYWNVTGNGWDVPIDDASAVLSFAQDVPENVTFQDGICFTGVFQSTAKNCAVGRVGRYIPFSTSTSLAPHEGLTVGGSFDKNIVDVYTMKQGLSSSSDAAVAAMMKFIFIIFWLLAPLGLLLVWFIWGRDPKVDGPIVRVYAPPSAPTKRFLTPIEVGALMDEKIDPRDISAEIVNLAIKKYIKIVEHDEKGFISTSKKIRFERGPAFQKDPQFTQLADHEKQIMTALQLDSVESSELETIKYSFAQGMMTLKKDLYDQLTQAGYFKNNPQTIRNALMGVGAFAIFIFGIPFAIGCFILARILPRRTLAGVKAKREALGLLQYLESQEDQLKFQEKEAYLFEKLLPYAIAFGVASIWAQKFAHLHNYKPDWYESSGLDRSNFTTLMLLNALNTNLNTIQHSYAATSTSSSGGFSSSFGGGGFSGGGFGGGGGSSW